MILVVRINAAAVKLPTSINEDAILSTRLWKQLWSSITAELENKRPFAICPFIDNCCENRSKAALLFRSLIRQNSADFTLPDIIKTCSSLTGMDKAEQTCPSYEQFISIPEYDKADFKKMRNVMSKYNKELGDVFIHVDRLCNDYEIHAVFCSSDKKAMESCATKHLQEMYDNGSDEVYLKLIMKIKENPIDLNQ